MNFDSSIVCGGKNVDTREYIYDDIYSPPLLLSFPGSGNTWLRLLIEYSTATYSGSIYGDKTLFKILPGERRFVFVQSFFNLTLEFT